MITIQRKGIATETIFYVIIGVIVVGLLSVLVYNYTKNTRTTGDCTTSVQNYCSWLQDLKTEKGATDYNANYGPDNKYTAEKTAYWTGIKATCAQYDTNSGGLGFPKRTTCSTKGFDV